MVILFNIHSVRTEIQTSLDQFWFGVVSALLFLVVLLLLVLWGFLFVCLVGWLFFLCVFVSFLFVCLCNRCMWNAAPSDTQPENASRRVVTSIVMQREPFF